MESGQGPDHGFHCANRSVDPWASFFLDVFEHMLDVAHMMAKVLFHNHIQSWKPISVALEGFRNISPFEFAQDMFESQIVGADLFNVVSHQRKRQARLSPCSF